MPEVGDSDERISYNRNRGWEAELSRAVTRLGVVPDEVPIRRKPMNHPGPDLRHVAPVSRPS